MNDKNVASRFRNSIVCMGLLALAPALSQASSTCSVTLGQAFEASGGTAWARHATLRIQGTAEQAGVSTPFTSTTDLRSGRWRDERQHGPFQLAHGHDGNVAWAEWKPGDVIDSTDPGAFADSITERYERMRAYWLTQRMAGDITCVGDVSKDGGRYSVHRIAPKGGRPFELWLDANTRMIARRVDRNGVFERTTRYEDYRESSGVRLPFRIHDVDYSGGVQVRTVSKVSWSVPGSALAKAETRLTDYSFPKGRDRVDVQLRLLNNHLYVPVKFNGRGPHWMILDTGACCLVNRPFAEALGLRAEGQHVLHGNGAQAAQLQSTRLDTIEIEGITLRDQRCEIIDIEKFEEFEGVEQFGLIGYEVYRRLVVRQDHAAGRITFIDRANFEAPRDARQVAFDFSDIKPIVAGSIDGLPGRFFIDTGSRNSASAYSWFVDRHDLHRRYPHSVEVVAGFGVGGAVRSKVARARDVRLGDVPFQGSLFDLPLGHAGAMSGEDAAVLVGTGLLRQYGVVTFDYEHRRMLFEQPQRNPPNDMDRSGFQMKAAANGFSIIDVVAGGPAAQAGLQLDDVVVAVNDRAASRWTLPELREYFARTPSGTSVRVEIMRRNSMQTVDLVLKDQLPVLSRNDG